MSLSLCAIIVLICVEMEIRVHMFVIYIELEGFHVQFFTLHWNRRISRAHIHITLKQKIPRTRIHPTLEQKKCLALVPCTHIY